MTLVVTKLVSYRIVSKDVYISININHEKTELENITKMFGIIN